jgi:hypothetical protein
MWKVLLSALLAGAMACDGDDGPSGPEDLPECSGPVTVTATTGPTPTFSWTPRCRVLGLIVETAESGHDHWLILTPSENALVPPVTFGDVPARAEETTPPEPLEADTAYNVGVWRWIGPGHDDGEVIGFQTFTP